MSVTPIGCKRSHRHRRPASLRRRFDPEDVVQSVFRTFFRRASEGLYDVPPGEQLWQLLLVLALNKVRALGVHHRAQKARCRPYRRFAGVGILPRRSRDETSLHVLSMVIGEVVGELPEIQQQMIQLRIEGYEVSQIAERTQRSKRTVERVLQKTATAALGVD